MFQLQKFKDDYDANAPMWRILPEFVNKYAQYEKVGLRDLCSLRNPSTRSSRGSTPTSTAWFPTKPAGARATSSTAWRSSCARKPSVCNCRGSCHRR